MLKRAGVYLFGLFTLLTLPSLADEGMWTFDNPPRKQLKERYNFEPTQEWLDHVRLSSVRVGRGGSGSFVSPNGRLLTNHHVARDQIQKLSTREKDLLATGFYAKTQAEEMKCPDLEVNVLLSMEDVTSQVLGAIKPGMSAEESFDARRGAIATITFVRTVVGDRTPETVAKELVGGTMLADVAVRKTLFENQGEAVATSADPLIVLARKMLPIIKENRAWTEKCVTSVINAANEKLGEARFAVYGKTMYPDATSSLRLSYGTVKGYPMNGTRARWPTSSKERNESPPSSLLSL